MLTMMMILMILMILIMVMTRALYEDGDEKDWLSDSSVKPGQVRSNLLRSGLPRVPRVPRVPGTTRVNWVQLFLVPLCTMGPSKI